MDAKSYVKNAIPAIILIQTTNATFSRKIVMLQTLVGNAPPAKMDLELLQKVSVNKFLSLFPKTTVLNTASWIQRVC